MKAIYRRIIVEGNRFVGVELTNEAQANGLAVALPQSVALARPARAKHRLAIPILGNSRPVSRVMRGGRA